MSREHRPSASIAQRDLVTARQTRGWSLASSSLTRTRLITKTTGCQSCVLVTFHARGFLLSTVCMRKFPHFSISSLSRCRGWWGISRSGWVGIHNLLISNANMPGGAFYGAFQNGTYHSAHFLLKRSLS